MTDHLPRGAAITIELARPLRRLAGGAARVELHADTAGEALQRLVERFPALDPFLLGPDGEPRRTLAVCLGDTDLRQLAGAATRLDDGVVLSLVPAVAGG